MKVNRFTPSSGIKILHSSNLLKLKPKLIVILAYLQQKNSEKFKIYQRWRAFYDFVSYPKIINSKNFESI